ncbi:amino acid adenylation domain-containing protein [Streptomyces sp. B1866]|uniref:Pls/PosA family non-ribosomal peptide synthetase n=1 Tax=Streptomyces sp. B1866 TaxID=3075431 RepID=UPI00288FEA8E|nr:Pls/PosA family non-ribosomal peptide synthetase [Streptomyces sp. B1866]MDT3399717.1 amino acid adenylation domain-containing protein [Streptomyces sp. B1866]
MAVKVTVKASGKTGSGRGDRLPTGSLAEHPTGIRGAAPGRNPTRGPTPETTAQVTAQVTARVTAQATIQVTAQTAAAPAADRAVYRSAPPAAPRTLLDVLHHSVTAWPDAAALDDGATALTYRELAGTVETLADKLRAEGVGAGDRVGVRMPSGSADLYLAILAVLAAGAAYVPVDADDPEERAALVWRESGVRAVLGAGHQVTPMGPARPDGERRAPRPEDDAWIIFTSGSTGRPKGVAVSHRSAAAFADAEARIFLPGAPVGPGDRVLAGLSVAFDASCEEMWLAWRHGACLVPAPRSLVRTGADLGPWLREKGITVVSTVPTLAALWSREMLADVRLLIVGGEACPPEVVRRFARDGREVWNTYGPTEATVVACAARLADGGPVRIGLPLDGWELAVVGPDGEPVAWGETGELVIGGVGLGRYLDPAKDAEKYAPLPALGWPRAYRSGDLVRARPEGLEFVGRGDDQVKIGGRRVELGEIEAALLALPSVAAATAVVQRTPGGLDVLVGYLVPAGGDPARFDRADALRRLREALPAPLVPRLAVLAEFPTRGSGKVDRAALPWPLPAATGETHETHETGEPDETTAWLTRRWSDLLGADAGPYDDFFDLGGTSLAAARLVSALRERFPRVSVTDLYRHPTPAALRERLTALAPRTRTEEDRRTVRPTPWWTGWIQAAAQPLLFGVAGLRWALTLALAGNVLSEAGYDSWLPTLSWWALAPLWLVLFTAPGRVVVAAAGVRALRGRPRPGAYPRGGAAHLRLWAAEHWVAAVGLGSVPGTPLAAWYARLLGCRVGARTDLRVLPPVTGLADFGDGCAVEPEADVSGWWLDGDLLRVGTVTVGAGACVGARATVLPNARVGRRARLLAGACVRDAVADGEHWGGSPAAPQPRDITWPTADAARSRRWSLAYLLTPALRGLIGWTAAAPTVALALLVLPGEGADWLTAPRLLLVTPLLVLVGTVAYALALAAAVRLAGRALRPGTHPAHSLPGWAAWLVHDLMESARRSLFPFYASLFTPVWLRLLGARVGRGAEVSTVLALPGLLRVDDAAFLADDVLAAPYELGGGWVRLGPSRVGARAFVGNSGVVGPDRSVGDGALIGVLSDTPAEVPDGSSWLGRPPMRLRRTAERHDEARTFAPPRRLRAARAAVELCRAVPVLLGGLLQLAVTWTVLVTWSAYGLWPAVAAAATALMAAGLVAGALAVAAKWTLMGRFRTARHPLWSAFVWRNELYDTFVEVLAVPWLVRPALGTPVLNWWLRALGARVGRGAWCETYWLPEPDLITVGRGASVNRGCVLQTHLFHDRVMRLEPVRLDAGATLGPHSVVLPGSRLDAGAAVGAGSLVMAAERVPGDGRWQGTPIGREA